MTPKQQAIQDWQEEGQFRPNQYPLGSDARLEYEEESISILNSDLANLWSGEYDNEPA